MLFHGGSASELLNQPLQAGDEFKMVGGGIIRLVQGVPKRATSFWLPPSRYSRQDLVGEYARAYTVMDLFPSMNLTPEIRLKYKHVLCFIKLEECDETENEFGVVSP